MSSSTEIEPAVGYRQFTAACDMLVDLIAKIRTALESPNIVEWRIPELQLEMARAYEALSRDEEAEATFASAAESAKRISEGPTSEEFVQFALGEFYLRRRMYDRALSVSQFIRDGDPSSDAWLLLNVRARAYFGLGLVPQAREAAAEYISTAPDKDGAKHQMEAMLSHASARA